MSQIKNYLVIDRGYIVDHRGWYRYFSLRQITSPELIPLTRLERFAYSRRKRMARKNQQINDLRVQLANAKKIARHLQCKLDQVIYTSDMTRARLNGVSHRLMLAQKDRQSRGESISHLVFIDMGDTESASHPHAIPTNPSHPDNLTKPCNF